MESLGVFAHIVLSRLHSALSAEYLAGTMKKIFKNENDDKEMGDSRISSEMLKGAGV